MRPATSRKKSSVPTPEKRIARFGSNPMTNGATTVAPNIASTCCKPMARSQDTRERQRLEALVRRLSDPELTRQMDDGWTVAAVLAHLALWDRRATVLVERWRRTGVGRSE